ncbi:MAG: spore coat protein U domain-containing protein [Burkholderiales bacterium]|nr:spore coat protein U domain-containing protein [Burkholderiales bacterium]
MLLTTMAGAQPAGCVISTHPLFFGVYDVAATSTAITTARMDLRCTLPASLTLGLQSANSSAASQMRSMRHTTTIDSIAYALFQDAAQSLVWGDGLRQAGRSLRVSGGTSIFVYGAIPAGQDPAIGEYRDHISVLVLP